MTAPERRAATGRVRTRIIGRAILVDMTSDPPFLLRRGRPEDALPILEVQRSAIRGTAVSAYGPTVINEWAPEPIAPERVAHFRRWIDVGEELIVVAVDAHEHIIGFGSIVPRNSELRAVYVAAEHGRRGAGSAILARLEAMARELGLTELRMASSINAVPFYEANGFISLERGDHRLPSGNRMACVRMRKTLGSSAARPANAR